MKMIRVCRFSALVATVALLLCGCEDSNNQKTLGQGYDFGSNDRNLYLAVGDSITYGSGSTSYPEILSSMLGKPVINEGIRGERTHSGAARIDEELRAYHPGFLLIMYGANDVVHQYSPDRVKELLRIIIKAAKDNHTIPVIATITPHIAYREEIFNPLVKELNTRIRRLAKEEGIRLVELQTLFDEHPEYIGDDGLHPTDEGLSIIAAQFFDVLR